MINVGLIGFGKWGKRLNEKLEKLSNVRFICRSKDDYISRLNEVDWVFVATPNHTHYEIVKECLKNGKNVFCEKPLTPTFTQSEELFNLADFHSVKLYVDDIMNWGPKATDLLNKNLVVRMKKSEGYSKELLYRLAYHDIYFLYDNIRDKEIIDIQKIESEYDLNFNIKFKDFHIEFIYDIHSENKCHYINGFNMVSDTDILYKMVENVLNEQVDYENNKEISLFTNKIIDEIINSIFDRVAVVGGGIFGCTAAWMLSKNNYQVDLYERHSDIIEEASYINQYRLHRGYHYPRSKETAISSKESEKSFLEEYGESVINGNIEHYYGIASENSFVNSDDYVSFLDDVGLEYSIEENEENCDLVIKVKESLFDPDKIKKICWEYLNKYYVNTVLDCEIGPDIKELYDYTIIASYSNINQMLHLKNHRQYQFELCEKPVLKLPGKYKNKSIVIMDGPFMCIDPFKDTGYHVMGNVVHAIHSTNTGMFPVYDPKFKEVLNKGVVKDPHTTNIDKFIESASEFFKDINRAKHIGSMFTIRTVLPEREYDDARPTLVEQIDDKTFTLFSGKIGTCVDASSQLLKLIE